MARNISVKIPTSLLISQIEAKIAEIDEAIANFPSALEQYEREAEAYKVEVAKSISDYLTSGKAKIGFDYEAEVRVSTNYAGRVELTIDPELAKLPKKPERPSAPNQNTYYGREHTNQKALLERNLKILRMTSQEEVNASTYGSIMEIL